jgi:hypothetical protein
MHSVWKRMPVASCWSLNLRQRLSRNVTKLAMRRLLRYPYYRQHGTTSLADCRLTVRKGYTVSKRRELTTQ